MARNNTMGKNGRHWLDDFVRQNAWAILVFLALMVAFYTRTNSQIMATERRIDKLEDAIIGITQNQTSILLLQQSQQSINEDVLEIKQNVKDIKDELQRHTN